MSGMLVGAKLKLLTDDSTAAPAPSRPLVRSAVLMNATTSSAPVALTATAKAKRPRDVGGRAVDTKPDAPALPSSDGCRHTRSSGGSGGRKANGSSSDESLRSTSAQPTEAPSRCGRAPSALAGRHSGAATMIV